MFSRVNSLRTSPDARAALVPQAMKPNNQIIQNARASRIKFLEQQLERLSPGYTRDLLTSILETTPEYGGPPDEDWGCDTITSETDALFRAAMTEERLPFVVAERMWLDALSILEGFGK